MTPLGVVLAGGRSRRYGAPKALVTVGGVPILSRVIRALGEAAGRVVLVANEPALYAGFELETRPDARPGLGALGGIDTAVRWAAETGAAGALVVACDMPFISGALLRRLAALAAPAGTDDPDVVVPESRGPRGVEPLCAWYGTRCGAALDAQVLREDRRIIGFWPDVTVRRLTLKEVQRFGDPDRLFMNVNTPDERRRAEALLAGEPTADAPAAGDAASAGDPS